MFEQLILIAALNQQPVNQENCEQAFVKQQSPVNQRWTPRDFYVGCHLLLKTKIPQARLQPVKLDDNQDSSWTSSVTPVDAKAN